MTQTQDQLKELLAKSGEIATAPIVALQIYQLCMDEHCSREDIAKLMKQDQNLVAKLLAAVNSPIYGIGKEITSIIEAVNVMGIHGIKNTVMMVSADKSFSCPGKEKLWKDSVGATVIYEGLSKHLKKPKNDIDFLVTLFHNMGRPILSKYFPNEYRPLLNLSLDRVYEKEYEIFGMDHREVGAQIVKSWDLPSEVVHDMRIIDPSKEITNPEEDVVNFSLKLNYLDQATVQVFKEYKEFADIKKAAEEAKSKLVI